MNFLKIAREDISVILKNRFVRVSVVAIIIVPLLYSLLYLYAFWNPYDKLVDMPVAVVNQDKGGVKDGKDVNYGKDVSDKLNDNKKIGWRFVDYDEAKSGVEGKKYYAMFVIPEDFTKNALTVENKELIQPKIYFTSNDKKNFLAAQINGKVVVELKAEITKSMTKEIDKVLFDNLNEIKDKMQLAADGSKKLSDGNKELADKLPEMKEGVGKLVDGASQIANGVNTTAVDNNGSPVGLESGIKALSLGLEDAKVKSKTLQDGATTLNAAAGQMGAGIGQLNAAVNVGIANKPSLKGTVSSLYTELTKTSANPNEMGLAQALTLANQYLNDKDPTNDALAKAIVAKLCDQANKSIGQAGFDGKAIAKPTLKDAVGGMYGSVVQDPKGLCAGIASLNAAVNIGTDKQPSFLSGMKSLKEGTDKFAPGMSKAYDASNALHNGAVRLGDASSQMAEGLSTLNGKMPELLDGTTKLKDGSKELSDKLEDGSKQLNNKMLNDSTTMSEFLSKPVEVHEEAINAVKTYGEGFAPYFISLSLWVGGMLLFFVIPVNIDEKLKARSSSIVLGKFLSYGMIGIVQAFLASAIVLTLGLEPNNILMYFAFNVLMSFVFIAIMQCLVFLVGDAGRLLSIVLLILQLTACAGTFPLEVVPTFFKVLNPFMPFTYTVEALREIISGTNYSIVAKDAGILVAIMAVSIFTSVLLKGHADKVQKAIKVKKEAVA